PDGEESRAVNATKLADWVKDRIPDAHRGAFVEGGLLVLFDNRGGIAGPRGVHPLELVLNWVRRKGYTVRGLSTCAGGYAWVMVLDPGDPDCDAVPADVMLWETFQKAFQADDKCLTAQIRQAGVAIERRPRLMDEAVGGPNRAGGMVRPPPGRRFAQ